jgi:hypothetical protein
VLCASYFDDCPVRKLFPLLIKDLAILILPRVKGSNITTYLPHIGQSETRSVEWHDLSCAVCLRVNVKTIGVHHGVQTQPSGYESKARPASRA